VTRTFSALLDDVQNALIREGLSDPGWVQARVASAERTDSGLIRGELTWSGRRGRFVCADRSLTYRLTQAGAAWEPGLVAVFEVRLVVHRRYGFQVEVLDVDVSSIRSNPGRGG
jgi:hypothetical protein